MAGTNIAQFYATLGIRVPTNEIQKVDKLISQIQQRFKRLGQGQKGGLDLSNIISFDQRKLRSVMQRAFDQVSRTTYFEIKNFRIDTAHLTSQLRAAMERASATTRLRPHMGEPRGSGGHGRLGVSAGIGAAGGLTLGRLYGPALAVAAGGYGLGALNRKNQEIQSAQLTTQAVVNQAGGTDQQGLQAFQWLQQQGNRVGFNWLSAANDYNNVISGITGAGGSVAQGQNIFKGFSEYGRVNHIDAERQKRVFRALSQIAGKNKLQSEELTGQLAESLPGAVSIFAEAYQRQTGGNLTGTDSIQALLAAMKKGQVTGSILNPAAQIASQRAAPSLAHSARTSQSEQARFQNEINRLTMVANQSGVESGYARLFKTMNDALAESGPLVRSLSQGFDELTKKVRLLYLIPQSFQRMMQGRDSFITDLIGKDSADQLVKSINDITAAWQMLKKAMSDTGWTEYLKSTVNEIKMILGEVARVSAAAAGADRYQKYLQENGTSESVAGIRAAGKFLATGRSETNDIPEYLRQQQLKYPLSTDDKFAYGNQFNDPISLMKPAGSSNTTNTINVGDINITTTATNPKDFGVEVQNKVEDVLMNVMGNTRLNYPSVGR